MKNVNIAFCGGASNGRGYFQIWKEIFEKNIKFNIYSGTSAGAVVGIPIMSGMSPEEGFTLFKKLKGDRYLSYSDEIKKANLFIKPFMCLNMIFNIRRKFWESCKILLQENFPDWNSVNIRCKKSYICFLKQHDVVKTIGNNFFKSVKEHGFIKTIKENKAEKHPSYYLEKIPVYYASNDGIYRYFKSSKLEKVSNTIIPPWKAILATFSNPLLPNVWLSIKTSIFKTLDGGFIDNYSCLPMLDQKSYLSVICDEEPTVFKNGIMEVSNYVVYMNKPDRFLNCTPMIKRDYLDYSDKALEEEYTRPSSNFFDK